MENTEITAKVREYKELQAMAEELDAELQAIADALKAELDSRNTEELTVDIFKVRYNKIQSSRFDAAAFKATHKALYAQYTKTVEARRFTIA
jgi:predicted phage-related endonuclease